MSFYTTEDFYAGYGKTLSSPDLSGEAFLSEIGANFEIGKEPNQFLHPETRSLIKGSGFTVYRKDNNDPFASVGPVYQIMQNATVINFLDGLRKEHSDVKFVAGGTYSGGRASFVIADLSSNLIVGKNDRIQNRLVIYWRHDGKGAITMHWSGKRFFCDNMVRPDIHSAREKAREARLLGKEQNFISIKHSGSMHDKLNKAGNFLGIITQETPKMQEKFNFYKSVKITDGQWLDLLVNTFIDDQEALKEINQIKKSSAFLDQIKNVKGVSPQAFKRMGAYNSLRFSARGQKEAGNGTLWQALNAFTFGQTHIEKLAGHESTSFKGFMDHHFGNGAKKKEFLRNKKLVHSLALNA